MMRPMIKYIKNNTNISLVGCEVGVCGGSNALSILQNLDIKMLYLVDPWSPHKIPFKRYSDNLMNDFYDNCIKILEPFSNKTIIKKKSVDAIQDFKDNFFDFIYIDGLHNYLNIKQDIELWYPKIKSGGILGGHDYNPSFTHGVITAVEELKDKYGLELFHEDIDWWVVKK